MRTQQTLHKDICDISGIGNEYCIGLLAAGYYLYFISYGLLLHAVIRYIN